MAKKRKVKKPSKETLRCATAALIASDLDCAIQQAQHHKLRNDAYSIYVNAGRGLHETAQLESYLPSEKAHIKDIHNRLRKVVRATSRKAGMRKESGGYAARAKQSRLTQKEAARVSEELRDIRAISVHLRESVGRSCQTGYRHWLLLDGE